MISQKVSRRFDTIPLVFIFQKSLSTPGLCFLQLLYYTLSGMAHEQFSKQMQAAIWDRLRTMLLSSMMIITVSFMFGIILSSMLIIKVCFMFGISTLKRDLWNGDPDAEWYSANGRRYHHTLTNQSVWTQHNAELQKIGTGNNPKTITERVVEEVCMRSCRTETFWFVPLILPI